MFGIVPITFVLDDEKANFYDEMIKFEQVFELFSLAKSKNNPVDFINQELDKFKIDLVDKKMQAGRSFSRYKLDQGCFDGSNVWFLKATRFN